MIDKDSLFFNEIKKQLLNIKCNNEECVNNNTPITHMYILSKDLNGVSFKITNNVCCENFKSEIEQKVSSIHQMYK